MENEEHASAIDEDCAVDFADERLLILERLIRAHEAWFNVQRGYEFSGKLFPAYAEFHSHGEKYVLTKRAKLWEVDAHEYLFFDIAGCLSADSLADWVEYMTTQAVLKVDPVPNHMNSYISLILVADSVAPDAKKAIRKTRFHKEFKFGLRGWADLRLAVIDLSSRSVLVNAAGTEMKASLEGNAGFESSKTSVFSKRR